VVFQPFREGYYSLRRYLVSRPLPNPRAQEHIEDEQPRRGSPENNQGDNVTLKTKRGNQAEYLTARIARDRPDIHDRMKAGEFPSVRKAAMAAGFVEPTDGHPKTVDIINGLDHRPDGTPKIIKVFTTP
jgi:hypothetical protein